MGIEPTQAVLETASPALEHSPLYPAFAYPPERVRVLSNARFNAGKSNGPSRSHALLTGHNARQVWACRNIAPVRCQLWDLVQTAGLEPASIPISGVLYRLSYVYECPLWDPSSGNPGREVRGVLCPTGIAPGRQGQVPVAGDELLLRAAAYIFMEHWQRRITRNAPCHGADGRRGPRLPEERTKVPVGRLRDPALFAPWRVMWRPVFPGCHTHSGGFAIHAGRFVHPWSG